MVESILVPFIFSNDDAYVLEAGDNYMRFIRRQARVDVSDTDAQIDNGGFGSGITSWTDQSTGSAAISHDSTNGALSLDGAAGGIAWAEQSVTTTSTGTEHVLRFKSRGTSGLKVKVQIGSTSTGAELFAETALGVGSGTGGAKWANHTVAFTPSASPFYVQFKNDNLILNGAEAVLIDDVELLDNSPLEIETPWASSDLPDLKWVQAGDVVYFTHPDYPTFKLERRGHTTWSLVQVYWNDGPWNDINPGVDLIDAQLSPNPDLLTGMSDWSTPGLSGADTTVSYDGSQQLIILQPGTGGGTATAEIEVPTGFRQGTSTIFIAHFLIAGGTEQGATNEWTALRVGSTTGAQDIVTEADFEPGWHTIKYTTASSTNHFFRFINTSDSSNGGVGALFVYAEDAQLLEPSATTGSVTVNARGFAPFVSTDVGRYLRFEYPGREPGWGIITAFTSTSQVTVQVRRKIARALPTESWRLGVWSETTGFPHTMAFFEGRSVLANNASNPRGMWFSQSLDLENMRPDSFVEGGNTVEDDDALNFTLASPAANDVQWLTALQQLVIGTLGGPWVAESSGPVITPADRTFRQQTSTKISNLDPLLIGNAIVFVDKSQTRVMDLGFQFEPNAYVAADLTQLADHIGAEQFGQIAFQQDPDPVVWLRRDSEDVDDGQLFALAYNRAENIIGWTRMEIGGSWTSNKQGLPVVESIAVIPGANDSTQQYDSGDRDEVWLVVKRTVDGNTVRYIEMFERRYEGPRRETYTSEANWVDAVQADQRHAFYVDSGITFDTGAKTITAITQADPAVVTAASHGFSDGDEIRITDVVGMKTLNGGKFLVADSAASTFALTAATSAVSITGATQANPVVITATAHGFSNNDVIGIFSVGGMTEINGRTFTVANVTTDTFELSGEDGTGHTAYTSGGSAYHATDSSGFSAYVSGGEARSTTTTITGLDHLEGETVDVLGDGLVETGLTVSNGQITTSTAYAFAHVGLPYTTQYESLKVHYGARQGTGIGKPKRITGLTLAVLDAGPFDVGTTSYDNRSGRSESSMVNIDPTRSGTPLGNVTTLATWETVEDLFPQAWPTDARIWITSDKPLPLTILGVGPNIDINESQASRK